MGARGPKGVLPAGRLLQHATALEIEAACGKDAIASVRNRKRILIDTADRWCCRLGLPLMDVWPEAYGDDLIPVAAPPMTDREVTAADRAWCLKSWRVGPWRL